MIVGVAAVAGAAMYYLQVYAFYEEVAAVNEVSITTVGGKVEPLLVAGFQGIDAESSPLRYRACFTVPVSLGMMTAPAGSIATTPPRLAQRSRRAMRWRSWASMTSCRASTGSSPSPATGAALPGIS
jgi:hypothetical protein